ncbi:hypothetical protein C8R43DRAFT_966736 [Mycena crocata]|nr:hypothetical protein C8R43DRAFT_966736 [Mycena crocata]
MRLRPPGPLQDPEKNSSIDVRQAPSLLTRLFSYILRPRGGSRPEPRDGLCDYRTQKEPHVHDPPYSDLESSQASARLWAIYVGEADRYDKTLVESWKADMEGMLIFSGLFSASLTAFLIESYRTLRPDSGDITVEILARISQQLVLLSQNGSLTSSSPPEFRPTRTSLVCNTLWFLSLSLSITCALLATLVEQWAREFIHKSEKRPSPVRRARVFSFLYFGVRRFGMHFVVDLIPMLLHVSLLLFLAGLVAFLLPINTLMMGLVSGVLAVFFLLYAALTLSPIITLDSPYRTPVSHLLWNILHKLHPSVLSHTTSASTMNEAVVAVALQHTEARDRLAFAWTLESLTDDYEFLPFLEAIPEAIHGAKGFHLLNDYLFIPLLNGLAPDKRSLGDRITEVIARCRKLVPEDPLRQRGLVAGLKAVWALGMISSRTGELFDHEERLWFDDKTRDAIRGPEDYGGRVIQGTDWPYHLSEAATVSVHHSSANNLRNYIANLALIAAEEDTVDGHHDFAASINTIIYRFQDLGGVRDIPEALSGHLDALVKWPETTSRKKMELCTILRAMTHDAIWLELKVTILCRFLVRSAYLVGVGVSLPHEYLHTCQRIVPRVPIILDASQIERRVAFMPRPKTFEFTLADLRLDPSRHGTPSPEISDLDRIMQTFFRLFPLLRLDDTMPIFVRYLVKRQYADPIIFATHKQCRLSDLLDCLVTMLGSDGEDADLLLAAQVILTLPTFVPYLMAWKSRRDEPLYAYTMDHTIFSSEHLASMAAIMIMRKLIHFNGLLPSEYTENNTGLHGPTIDEWRKTDTKLLSGGLTGLDLPEYSSSGIFDAEIRHRIKKSMIVSLTNFIAACLRLEKPRAMAGAMRAVCECLPRTFDTIDTDTMTDFARAWLDLVNCLIRHPNDGELNSATQTLFLCRNGPAFVFYNPAAAGIFLNALDIYLVFLQDKTPREETSIRSIIKAMDTLISRMSADGVNIPETSERV